MVNSNITEKMIENQILTFLRNKGIFVWKNQSTGLFDPTRKVFRKSNNPHHISGVSDILGILKDGRFLAIEVKKPYVSKKTLKFKYRTQEELQKLASIDQVNFIEKIKLSNGIAFYADSLEVVEDQLTFAKIEQG
jgi:hypothetical protein